MIKGICKWNFCGNILTQMDAFWRLGLLVTWILWLFWNRRRATTKRPFWSSFTLMQSLQKDRGNREPYRSTIQHHGHPSVFLAPWGSPGAETRSCSDYSVECMSACEGLVQRSLQDPSLVLKMLPPIFLLYHLSSCFCLSSLHIPPACLHCFLRSFLFLGNSSSGLPEIQVTGLV